MSIPRSFSELFSEGTKTAPAAEEEEEEEVSVPLSEPVSPATPPSAGSGGEGIPRSFEELFDDRPEGLRGAQNYVGETWDELGIKLPDSLREDLGGQKAVIPKAEVEKAYISDWWASKGYAGQMAFDMVALRDKVADARAGAWMRQYKQDTGGEPPTQEEYNAKYIELAKNANDEIYALAEKTRGARASVLPGSQGINRRFLWLDTDIGGKLYGEASFGPVKVSTAKQEERGFFSHIFSPFVTNMAGAEANLLVEDIDEEGKVQPKFIKQPYNESHFLGWLDWLGRESILTYASTAAVAGQSEDPESWAAGSGGGALALINPVNYWRGWGSDKQLELLSRGEDIISLREELQLRKLHAMSYIADGAEAVGLISPETNQKAQNITEFITAFGLAIADPDVLSLMTFGTGKIANLKAVGKLGDVLGTSSRAKSMRRGNIAEEIGEELAILAESAERDTFALRNAVEDSVNKADLEQKTVALNNARAIGSSDPKASKATESLAARVKNFFLEGRTISAEVGVAGIRGRISTEAGGKLARRIAEEETPTLKAARKQQQALEAADTPELRAARKGKRGVVTAKKIGNDIESYKKAQLDDMWAASVLSDLRTQKLVASRLRSMTRASKAAVQTGAEALRRNLQESAERIQSARRKMQEAWTETATPRGTGKYDPAKHTAKYTEAKREHDLAIAQFQKASIEASTKMGDDAERFLDELIANATTIKAQSAKTLKQVTKKVEKRGTFKINPKEHNRLVNGMLKNAPKALEERALISALAVAFKEQAAAYKKLSNFIEEARPAGGVKKAIVAYNKAAGEGEELVPLTRRGVAEAGERPAPLRSSAFPAEEVGNFKYTGFKGIKDRAELRDKLVELSSIYKVTEWIAQNVDTPIYKELARKLLEVLPNEPESKVIVVDNAMLRRPVNYRPEGIGDATVRGTALGESNYRMQHESAPADVDKWLFQDAAPPTGFGTISLMAHDELMSGLTAETILHEILHAATQEQVRIASAMGKTAKKKTELGRAYKRLERIAELVYPESVKYVSREIDSAAQNFGKMTDVDISEFDRLFQLDRPYASTVDIYMLSDSLARKLGLRTGSSATGRWEIPAGRWALERPEATIAEVREDDLVRAIPKLYDEIEELDNALYTLSRTGGGGKTVSDAQASKAAALIKGSNGILTGYNKIIGRWTEIISPKRWPQNPRPREAGLGDAADTPDVVYRGLPDIDDMREAKGLSRIGPEVEALIALLSQRFDAIRGEAVRIQSADFLSRKMSTIGGVKAAHRGKKGLNVHELITLGLTDPLVAKFLKSVKMPKEKETIWTGFVSSIAKLLGISPKHRVALTELLSTTEQLMDIPLDKALGEAGSDIMARWVTSRLPALSKRGALSRAAELDPADARKADDLYMIEQVELITGWMGKLGDTNYGRLGKMWLFAQRGVENMWDPAQRILGPASEDVQQIGIAMFGQIRKMQEDLVYYIAPAAKKAGDEAEKTWTKLAPGGPKGREAFIAKKRAEAESEAFIKYITSTDSIGGSVINTIFGISLWDMAKPMLRASAGGKKTEDASMAFNTLFKMWLPPGVDVPPDKLGSLASQVRKLLKYGDSKAVIKHKTEKELADMRAVGDNLTFEDFSKGVESITSNIFTGIGRSDKDLSRVNAFAAQAITQMALMSASSTRLNKVLADFSPSAVEAAVRLSSGMSLDPGADMVEAMQVLNKLKIPGKLRELGDSTNKTILIGLELYSDGDGFKAIVPRTWMQKTSEQLAKIEKTADAVKGTITDPWERQALNAYQGFYRLFHTAILTGLVIPRAAYFTNIYIGNFGQLLATQGFVSAMQYAGRSAKDIVGWAPQKLASQTPLGKYVDEALTRMDAKHGPGHRLSSLTNAFLNRNISQIMDPSLADNGRKIIGKGGKSFTMGELRKGAVEQGVFTSFASAGGLANLMSRINPGFGKKFWDQVSQGGPLAPKYADFANTLEQRQRVGLFTDLIVNKGMTPEEAGKITREAFYDWDAPMTKWETRFAKHVFMFYNFTRRAMGQAMRILLDPYIKSADDTLTEGILRSSPVLSMITGKKAYQSANVMAMERARREIHEAMTDEETAAEYPWWAEKAHYKMFFPNTPMGDPNKPGTRAYNYSQTLGRDVDYKVLSMPSLTPVEMVNQWGEMFRILGAYGVATASRPASHIIGAQRPSQVGFGKDVLMPIGELLATQAGPIGEDAMKGVLAAWGGGEQSYLREGVPVTRLSDRKLLSWLETSLGPFMGGITWEDKKNPGMVRTTPQMMGLLRGIPGFANEFNTVIGPWLDVSAEGGEVSEKLLETMASALNFKTYRYSPKAVRDWDMKEIKTKMGTIANEEKRKMPIGTAAAAAEEIETGEPGPPKKIRRLEDIFK